MSSSFNQGGSTPYFFPPDRRKEAKQWLRENGHQVTLAGDVIDLYGRWYHNQAQSFSGRRLQEDYGYGRKATDTLVSAVMALAGLSKVDHTGPTGKVQGFHLERVTSPDQQVHTQTSQVANLSDFGQQKGNKRATSAKSSASPGTQVRSQEQQVRSQEHHVRPQEHTNKEVNKEVNKESYKEEELSPTQSVRQPESKDEIEHFLRQAARYAVTQQMHLGVEDHDSFSDASFATYLAQIADLRLSDDEVVSRILNCLSWTATQSWSHGRPYAGHEGLAAAFTHHLKGRYPAPPSDEDNLDRDRICSVHYVNDCFVIYDVNSERVGLMGNWAGFQDSKPSEPLVDASHSESHSPVKAVSSDRPRQRQEQQQSRRESYESRLGMDVAATERAKAEEIARFKSTLVA